MFGANNNGIARLQARLVTDQSLAQVVDRAVEGVTADALRTALEPRVCLNFEGLTTLVFQTLTLRRGLFHVCHSEWPTSARPVDMSWPAVCSSASRKSGGAMWVFDMSDAVVRLHLTADGIAMVSFAADCTDRLAEAEQAMLELLPRQKPVTELNGGGSAVPMTFWSSGGGRLSTRRTLAVPSWSEIRDNYATATRSRLEPLFDGPRPGRQGQLILWHGPPGTGKTHAIRALAHAWRSWCDVHYVTDPEVFFGAPTSYMRDVLLDSDDYYELDEEEETPDDQAADARWRLLVLEDTGELLGIDAKLDSGQGLSRLLNIVDGLLGQGLRLIVMITTNEPIARIHPAIVRPGRCAASIGFHPMSRDEASAWLHAHGAAATAGATVTLAELYNLAAGGPPPAEARRVGFA